jgi:3-hydroxy-3-methylglutaryl CoA synthase/uncharacterized OB-fold protein
MSEVGIVSWASYLPSFRLDRAMVSKSFSVNSGKGTRTVASYDEDSSTMAVEAARRVDLAGVQTMLFSTTRPPLMDKGNASTMAAVLGLGDAIAAFDLGGSSRSTVGCLKLARSSRELTLLVGSDIRFGRPGSDDEINGSDGAFALTLGPNPQVKIGEVASVSSPTMDRWRSEGDVGTQTWDDRWTAEQQTPLMVSAGEAALHNSGITRENLAAVVVSSPSPKVNAAVLSKFGGKTALGVDQFGYFGAADLGIRIASALSSAGPRQHLLVVSGADGADAFILTTSDNFSPDAGHGDASDAGISVSVIDYLAWRGLVHREPPRRPDPEIPAAPAVSRNDDWKFAFTASRCAKCSSVHLPPQRVCMTCGAIDSMDPVPMRDAKGKVRTYTIDRIAFSPNPPVVVAVIDFDGGGRYRCQLTDVDPQSVQVGMEVEMTYRLISTARNGIRNYFWKARPLKEKTS